MDAISGEKTEKVVCFYRISENLGWNPWNREENGLEI